MRDNTTDTRRILDNLREALAAFAHVRPQGSVAAAPGLSLVSAGVPYGLFNTALLTGALPGPDGGFPDLLDRAQRHFRERSVAWSLWFCEDLIADAARRHAKLLLAARGFKPMMEAPGMVADEIAPPSGRLAALDCVRVDARKSRLDFSQVMSAAFLVPEAMAQDVYGGEWLWQGPMAGWVGYVRSQPVTTACIVPGGEALGLYAVATHPRHQRKGYAEALMRHAIAEAAAATGYRTLVLQSTTAGYRLYVRLGFRQSARFAVYLS